MANSAVLAFTVRHLRSVVSGATVLEVGSRVHSGRGIRTLLERYRPARYVGLDIREGPGVDRVGNVAELALYSEQFDVVFSNEMLEHVRDWRGAIRSLKAVTKPGGTLLVTTRSEGFGRHCYPDDHWRFSVRDFDRIFAGYDDRTVQPDPIEPGVFFCGSKGFGPYEADLESIEPVPAPTGPDGHHWKRRTVRHLLTGIPSAVREAGWKDGWGAVRADYPERVREVVRAIAS